MDELKKIKHVVQYGIFAAYHLALETSFLADEGATLPELPLKSPLTVSLPDKRSTTDNSISAVPGFTINVSKNQQTDSFDHLSTNYIMPTDPGETAVAEAPVSSECLPSQNTYSCSYGPSCANIGNFNHGSGDGNGLVKVTTTSASVSIPSTSTSDAPTDHSPRNSNMEKKGMHFGDYHDGSTRSRGKTISMDSASTLSCYRHNTIEACTNIASSYIKESLEGSYALPNVKTISKNNVVILQPVSSAAPQNQETNQGEDTTSSKDEVVASEHQSILVSLSTRCVWKGTICERSQLLRIKYYGNFDKPLGRFLRDYLFNQVLFPFSFFSRTRSSFLFHSRSKKPFTSFTILNVVTIPLQGYQCRSCDKPPEAHVHCYTHRQGSLTISVRKLTEIVLSGERDGKIWMWHRCLKCPWSNGFPPATQRIVMSDAAWGLSLGKFLELSFSNHAAASRVASCGHSLHRDCLRFYG
jgi:1-phosphatidylinositol-3-phosphate 5-kinase